MKFGYFSELFGIRERHKDSATSICHLNIESFIPHFTMQREQHSILNTTCQNFNSKNLPLIEIWSE